MTTANASLVVASRFFDAIERGDLDEVRALYAPDAVIWHNTDRIESTVAENLQVLGGFVRRIRDRRYEGRRLQATPEGFVQQHLLTGTRADGARLALPACVLCQVQGGRITRLDEYFDTVQVAPWMIEFPDR